MEEYDFYKPILLYDDISINKNVEYLKDIGSWSSKCIHIRPFLDNTHENGKIERFANHLSRNGFK